MNQPEDETAFAIGVPGLEPEKRNSPGWKAVLLHMFAALVGFVGPAVILGNLFRTSCRGQLTACKSNCKNIATALEMYASDNKGRYRATLAKLTEGNYLMPMPTCPAAGKVTYLYHCSSEPDSFRFACAGNNHAKAFSGFSTSSNNYPRYNSEEGLVDHP